jgi:hypothetical protein
MSIFINALSLRGRRAGCFFSLVEWKQKSKPLPGVPGATASPVPYVVSSAGEFFYLAKLIADDTKPHLASPLHQ